MDNYLIIYLFPNYEKIEMDHYCFVKTGQLYVFELIWLLVFIEALKVAKHYLFLNFLLYFL